MAVKKVKSAAASFEGYNFIEALKGQLALFKHLLKSNPNLKKASLEGAKWVVSAVAVWPWLNANPALAGVVNFVVKFGFDAFHYWITEQVE